MPDLPASRPEFSIVVPVYRQWDLLPVLLASLAGQSLAPDRFEILLVDNEPSGSGDAAPALPANARLLACATPGSYAARNAGAAQARGAWLVFTDADCRSEPGWLASLAAAAVAHPAGLLAGPVRLEGTAAPNPCEIYDMVRGIPQARYVARGYAATANLAVPAALFRGLGGFDAARFSGGDAEFCRRAGRAGHALTLVPAACVTHPARASWDELAAKARRIKGGQIAAGPVSRRLAWTLRSFAPPLRDSLAYLAATDQPPAWRRTAVALRFRLWGIELGEVARLLLGGTPQR